MYMTSLVPRPRGLGTRLVHDTLMGSVKVKTVITLTARVCIVLFKAIGKLQRAGWHHSRQKSRAIVFMDECANNSPNSPGDAHLCSL